MPMPLSFSTSRETHGPVRERLTNPDELASQGLLTAQHNQKDRNEIEGQEYLDQAACPINRNRMFVYVTCRRPAAAFFDVAIVVVQS